MRDSHMDDFGYDYRCYLKTHSISSWYISMSAYGGYEDGSWATFGMYSNHV